MEDPVQQSRINCKYGITLAEYNDAVANDPSFNCAISQNEPEFCAYRKEIVLAEANPLVAVATRCCYTVNDGALFISRSTKPHPLTQWYITTNVTADLTVDGSLKPAYKQLIFDRALEDEKGPFKDCTETSSCDAYYERRPIPTCSNYVAPFQGKLLQLNLCLMMKKEK